MNLANSFRWMCLKIAEFIEKARRFCNNKKIILALIVTSQIALWCCNVSLGAGDKSKFWIIWKNTCYMYLIP